MEQICSAVSCHARLTRQRVGVRHRDNMTQEVGQVLSSRCQAKFLTYYCLSVILLLRVMN